MAVKRQTIVDNLKTRLGTILTTGGYYTNLGQNVYEYFDQEADQSDTPMVAVMDSGQTIVSELSSPYSLHIYDLDIELIVLVSAGSNTMRDLRRVIADINECMKADPFLSGVLMDNEPLGDEVVFVQEEEKIASASVKFRFRYSINSFDEE